MFDHKKNRNWEVSMRSVAGRLRHKFLVSAGFGLLVFVSSCSSGNTRPNVRTTSGATDGIYIEFMDEIWNGEAFEQARARIRGDTPAAPSFLCERCEYHVSQSVYEQCELEAAT